LTARPWARVFLFLSSYSPLFLIFGILNGWDSWISAIFYAIAAVSVVALYAYWLTLDATPYSFKVKSVSSRDSDVMAYIVSYLVPFLTVSFTDVAGAVSFVVFIVVIGIIYVSSNMVYINPILNLRGYHLFEVESEGDDEKVSALISKHRYVSPGSTIQVVSLGDFAILEKAER
jgi:hypothetical protein